MTPSPSQEQIENALIISDQIVWKEPLPKHKILAFAYRSALARAERAEKALREIDALEQKCSNAWAGGIGDADLSDLGEMGQIARRALNTSQREETHDPA